MKTPGLKYICLSDLHLGEEDSLLTNLYKNKHKADTSKPSPVILLLKDFFYRIIKDSDKFPEKKPTLIILGDGLDLALSYTNTSVMAFERFIETFFCNSEEPLFNEIIYIPGNHDHHIWETARELQYAKYIDRHFQEKEIPIPWHRTKAIPKDAKDFISSPILKSAVSRVIQRKNIPLKIQIKILYPNFIEYNPERNRFIVFHHGHFFERLYYLMSDLQNIIFPEEGKEFPPENINNIEAENFAWIDFFWSTMGRSGKGEKVDRVWEMLQSERGKEKLIENLSKGLAKKFDIPLIPGNYIEEKTLKIFLKGIAKLLSRGLERRIKEEDLSKSSYGLLRHYISKVIFNQIRDELGLNDEEIKNSELTLIFGHTHKPLNRQEKIEPYTSLIKIYNTGGWVSDHPKLDPVYGGMAVFVDEEDNVVGLKLFSLGTKEKLHPVEEGSSEDKPSYLHKYLTEKVDENKDVLEEFSITLQRAAEIRAAHLRKLID